MTDRRDYGGFLGDTKVNRTQDYATSFAIPGTVDRIFSIHANSLEILARAFTGIRCIVGEDLELVDLNDSKYILEAIAAGGLDEDYVMTQCRRGSGNAHTWFGACVRLD